MGANQRRRKLQAAGGLLTGGSSVEPPFCPIIGGVLVQQVGERIISVGAKEVEISANFLPLACLTDRCMFYGKDEEGGFCKLVEAVDDILSDGDDGEEDGGDSGEDTGEGGGPGEGPADERKTANLMPGIGHA